MKSTKLLMAEHGNILEALHVLDAMCTEIENGGSLNKDDISSLVSFLRTFADGSHHVKEEAMFFPALMQAGMTLQDGPLRVMAYEHERGRALTSAIEEAASRNDKKDFLMYGRRYVQLLSEHIEKENYVLFDMADQTLTDEEDQKVADAFTHFDQNIVGMPTYERVHSLLEKLASKYLGVRALS
jgi:hemerythrin-like domain-containing protein